MRCISTTCLLTMMTASVSFCGEFVSQTVQSEPIFRATGIYAPKPQAPIELTPPRPEEELPAPQAPKSGLSEETKADILKITREIREELDRIQEELRKEKAKNQPATATQKPKATVRMDYSAYSPWYESGTGTTSDRHLIQAHGVSPSELAGLSQDQKNRLHGMKHGERPHATRVTSTFSVQTQSQGSCPNGNCPTGLFGRRGRR